MLFIEIEIDFVGGYMATIYDISKLAGVSPTTVSKVLNNYSDVSQKTKDKVNKIIKEIGYVPNLGARSTRTKRSYLIGVVFSENLGIGLEHPFFSVVLEAFRGEVGSLGYDTIFINNKLGPNDMDYIDHSKYRNVDGLFIITALSEELDLKKLKASSIPCVTTDMIIPDMPYVLSDHRDGVKQAIDYLIKMGHKNIGHIEGPLDTIAGLERKEAFDAYIKDLGLKSNDTWPAQSFSLEDGYQATLNLLENLDKNKRPSALFVSGDLMAIGAMEAIKSMGLSVPEDLSIIGFDGLEVGHMVSPKLTTIWQDKIQIGKLLAKTLIKHLEEPKAAWHDQRIKTELVIRDSVKKI